MEDLFQIIFILIFILGSIASSMKKKKKKQQQMKKTPRRPVGESTAKPPMPSNKKQKSSAEMLEEMFGLKVELPEPPKKEAPKIYSEETIDVTPTWDPAKEYEDTIEELQVDYKDRISARKSEFREEKKKHEAFKKERIIPKRVKKSSKTRKLFTSQTNLKDYILVQEILNKPKALRR